MTRFFVPREMKAFLVLFYVTAFLVCAATVSRYSSSYLVFDEAEFALQAKAINRYGVPKIPIDEGRRIYLKGNYLGYPAYLGMWHPPVYLYSLALAERLFGGSNAVYRLTSFAWFLPSLWLAAAMGMMLRGQKGKLLGLLTVPLALLVPLISEGSLFIDIDNSSLAFFIMLLAALYIKEPEDASVRKKIILALIFFGALCSKLTTPYIFLAAIVIYQSLRGRMFLGISQAVWIGGLGTALFAAAYAVYCQVFDYPWRFMFEFTYVGKSGMVASSRSWVQSLHVLRWHAVWFSPGMSLLLIALFFLRVKRLFEVKSVEKEDFLWIFFLLGFIAYSVCLVRWGKYLFPVLLAVLPAVASELARVLETVNVRRWSWFLGVILIWSIAHYFLLPILQVRPSNFNMHLGLLNALKDPRNISFAAAVLSFVAFYFTAGPALRGNRKAVLITSLAAYLALANTVNASKLLAGPYDRGPYSPNLGTGIEETLHFLNQELARDVIYCAKDLSFYFLGRHCAIDDFSSFGTIRADDVKRFPKIRYVVDSLKYPNLNWTDEDRERNFITLFKRIGDYAIYRVETPEIKNEK